MLSTSVNNVYSWKSVNTWFFVKPTITFFTDFTRLSQAPPMWGDLGGLKFHSICSDVAKFFIATRSSLLITSFSSEVIPRKLVPLSENISTGQPRRFTNLRTALMNVSVSALSTTSRCTHLTVMHVKITPQRFNFFRFCLMVMGPNKSTPHLLNGGSPTVALHRGRSDMSGYMSFARLTLQKKQRDNVILMAVRALSTQYCRRKRASTWSTPTCPFLRCNHSTIMVVTAWLLGRIAGCLSIGASMFLSLPPARSIPSLSMNGWRADNLLLHSFPSRIFFISSENSSSCTSFTINFSAALISSVVKHGSSSFIPPFFWQFIANRITQPKILLKRIQFENIEKSIFVILCKSVRLTRIVVFFTPSASDANSGTVELGQCASSSCKKAGPENQLLEMSTSGSKTPREIRSAGFSVPETWSHWEGSDKSLISAARFLSNTFNLLLLLFMYCNEIVESLQNLTREIGRPISWTASWARRAPALAALSSRRGRVTTLIGARRDFAITRLQSCPPPLYEKRT